MATFSTSFFIICLAFIFTSDVSADDHRQVYIVYMGTLPETEYAAQSHHLNILQEVVGNNAAASNLLIRSYKKSFNGFAANLSLAESRRLEQMEEVVSVFPNKIHKLATTKSWDFVGLGERAKRENSIESDIIVGMIDTGIWPESESFDDKGFGPPPKKWKGSCKGGQNFTCNNKLIGARFYAGMDGSARDYVGHGTHTASTAAGNVVPATSFYGFAQGTARGGVPSARLAVYKVCSKSGCSDADILAAFDDAIADGVDVISISIGSLLIFSVLSGSTAIGSFHAMSKGIITVAAAGNEGPDLGLLSNISPWMITVAASSTERRLVDRVVLSNTKALTGFSVNTFNSNGTKFPVVFGQNISRNCSEPLARACSMGCVNKDLVKGKIVVCDRFFGYKEPYLGGAIGAILQNKLPVIDASNVFPFPALSLNTNDYATLISYIKSTEKPEAEILRAEEIFDKEAPYVASFSSRGPSSLIPNLLKPDISAPGTEILAAFSPQASPSENSEDKRSVRYSVLSGTSMACPHVTGMAIYVKSFHPDWSPSAIKSAIMTTAKPMNATKNPEQEFAYGSGQINPTKATDPGLVYEVETEDYLKMLCAEGFSPGKLTKVLGQNVTCSDKTEVKDLNYPTMTTFVAPHVPFNITFRRTVTNVGFPNSTYKASVVPLRPEIKISIEPEVLKFGFLKEKKSFVVTISSQELKNGSIVSSSLVWSDGTHNVRSPIVAYSIKS